MSKIRAWLEENGLGAHAERFEAERIDHDILPQLTDEALTALGLPLGDRLRLLGAIKDLEAPPAPRQEAERRQITVMFCDLVGSTALSEKLDPEDLRTLMQNYQQAAGAVIERYGGHVAQYLGDGLMTYFGWPQAHEDDAERAVRASLDIVEAVGAMDLAVRIGIATGPVVVGETGAGDASVPKLAVGETPNLAARLQGLAGPDEIVVGPSTRRLLGGTFELVDMGEQALKGIVEPVQAHRVGGLAVTEGRFEAQHPHLTPLVGREAEMAMVMARWEQACAGEGQAILLSGEPGIGKSRITQALRERVADEPHTRLRYQCSPYHTNSALHPVIERIERATGFARDDTPDAKLDKLEQIFASGAGRALVASLLSLPVERYPALAMSPQKQKEETLRTLAEQVTELAAIAPVLLILEDAHWIDPTSQELFDLVVPVVASHRVLAIITHRPEYTPPWSDLSHVTQVALDRLGRSEAAAMAARVSDAALPDHLLDEIVTRTDGVPLFVEELTKTVVEDADVSVPATLQDSLMARLDRLGSAKEIAQIGACIGREFSHDLLAMVSPLTQAELSEALLQLVHAELIHRAGSDYIFKHALVQDAAYDTLLRTRRQELHERIGMAIEERLPEIAAAEPEAVFRHFAAAGLVEPALPYAVKAGQAAMARGAPESGINHLLAGLELLEGAPGAPARAAWELDLRLELGTAYIFARGWAFPDVKPNYERCRELVALSPDPHKAYMAAQGIFYYYNVTGMRDEADLISDELLELATQNDDPQQLLLAYQARAQSLFYRARYAEAQEAFEQSASYYDASRDVELIRVWGVDFLDYDLISAAVCHCIVGRLDTGLDLAQTADEHVRALGQPAAVCFSQWWFGLVHWFRGESEATLAATSESVDLATNIGFGFYVIFAGMLKAAAEALTNRRELGAANFSEAMANADGVGARIMRGYQVSLAVPAYAEPETCGAAHTLIDETLADCTARGDRFFDAHLLTARGVIKRLGRIDDLGEADFKSAIDLARGQSALYFELRATIELAKLWQDQAKASEARAILAPVYGSFTEGLSTAHLEEAKALLDELGA